jgi:hypothetical protein
VHLQCLDGMRGVNRYEECTPERNGIGHTPARASSEQVREPMASLKCKFLLKNVHRTHDPNARMNPPAEACCRLSPPTHGKGRWGTRGVSCGSSCIAPPTHFFRLSFNPPTDVCVAFARIMHACNLCVCVCACVCPSLSLSAMNPP